MVAQLIAVPEAGVVVVHCPQYYALVLVHEGDGMLDTINMQVHRRHDHRQQARCRNNCDDGPSCHPKSPRSCCKGDHGEHRRRPQP